jgi:hypothetical protein
MENIVVSLGFHGCQSSHWRRKARAACGPATVGGCSVGSQERRELMGLCWMGAVIRRRVKQPRWRRLSFLCIRLWNILP